MGGACAGRWEGEEKALSLLDSALAFGLGKMEVARMENVEENLDLLNFDQEDDNLLLATSPVPEVFLGVSPPSPAPISDSNKKATPVGELENCNGNGECFLLTQILSFETLNVNECFL